MLSRDQFRRLFAFLPIPSLMPIFIFILPPFDSGLFLEEFPLCSLNMVLLIFLLLFLYYECSWKPLAEEELAMVSEGQRSWTTIAGLVWEDCRGSERKRIASGNSRYLGTRANRDLSIAVWAWLDIDFQSGKRAGSASEVVFVKNSRMWEALSTPLCPGALEGRTLKDALEKMIREYRSPTCRLMPWMGRCRYGRRDWRYDLSCDPAAPMTNAVRHGHASQMSLHFLRIKKLPDWVACDNGLICTLTYGYVK